VDALAAPAASKTLRAVGSFKPGASSAGSVMESGNRVYKALKSKHPNRKLHAAQGAVDATNKTAAGSAAYLACGGAVSVTAKCSDLAVTGTEAALGVAKKAGNKNWFQVVRLAIWEKRR
jgi:hypothetical protein